MPKKREDHAAGEPGTQSPRAKRRSSSLSRGTAVLSEREGDLLSISDRLRDGAAFLDAEGKIRSGNERFWEIMGVSERSVIGRRLDSLEALSGNGLSTKLARLLSGHEVPPFELKVRSETGQTLSLEVHLIHVRRAADPPGGAVAIVRDISDQRRLQQESLMVDETSRLVVENADEGIVVVQNGKVVFVNQRAADLSGKPIEGLLSRSFLEFVYPADQKTVEGQHLRRLRGEYLPRAYSFRVTRTDGSIAWADASAVACTWQGKPAFLCFVKDITERRKVEDQLKESERRYRLLAENLLDVIWVIGTDLKFTYVSPSVERLVGYTAEEAVTKSVRRTLTAASFEVAMAVMAAEEEREQLGESDQGRSVSLELELLRQDGSTVWTENWVSYLRDSNGRVSGYLGVSRDMSERQRARDALRASEERLRTLIEESTDAIAIVDPSGTVIYESPSVDRITGYRHEEWEGTAFSSWHLHPDDIVTVVSALEQASSQPNRTLEGVTARYRHKDGTWRTLEATVRNLVHDPKVGGFLINFRDITDRLRVQEALRESERRYRLIADNASDIIWVVDADLRITYASPSTRAVLGYSVEEVTKGTFDKLLTPDSLAHVTRWYRDPLARERRVTGSSEQRTVEVEAVRKDGSTVRLEAAVTITWDAEGHFAGFQGACRDITQRKRAEEALREAKAKLDLLLQQMPCLCWSTDTEIRFISCAGGLIEAPRLGRLVGTKLADYRGVDDHDNETMLSAHRRALAGAAESYELAYRGRVFYCRVEPLRGAANSLEGVVGAAVDITDYKNLASQMRTLSRRLISVQEDERRAIASELHDQIGQSLTALKLLLENAQTAPTEADVRRLAAAGGVVNELMARVREMSLDLRPAMLDDLGLLPTLLWHFKRYTAHTRVEVKFKHAGLRRPLPPGVSIAAYRIVQEALTNVARYGKVSEVSVCVRAERGTLVVEVADHGIGFDEAKLAGQPSSGIRGMRERALALDGKFAIRSVPGQGTYVMAELPCRTASRRKKEK